MKKFIFCLIAFTLFFDVFAQMQVKDYNFSSFRTASKKVTPLLDAMSSPKAKEHPEYGVLPFNAGCRECVELIDTKNN